MADEGMHGVALVQRHGSTVAERAGGIADLGHGSPCIRTTRFQICSLSKQFAAAAVLLLVDRRRVTLDDPAERWFRECPEDWRPITVRHLLTHTSGLGHWSDCPDLDLGRPVPREQQMELFQRMPLLSRPGSRWRYSSPGYVLLGWIVQEASGQPYASFLAEHIVAPLGLGSRMPPFLPATRRTRPGSRVAMATAGSWAQRRAAAPTSIQVTTLATSRSTPGCRITASDLPCW